MQRKLEHIRSIEQMRARYHKKVPKMFAQYCDSGSWSQTTYHANEKDFQKYCFRQRVLVDIKERTLATNILGKNYTMPVILAPTGLLGMQHADGEILAAKAAERFGIPYTLSTLSICSLEDVAEKVSAPFWFQLYVMKDRNFTRELINRAKAVGCSALVLTVDLQMIGERHADFKNGLSIPPKLTCKNLLNMATKFRWWSKMLTTSRRNFGNIVGHVNNLDNLSSLSSWVSDQFDLSLNWNDIAWIKDQWQGPIIIKGILDVDDAHKAVAFGADAIVVSNHGGRQLDGALSSISMLNTINQAVGNKLEILLDGGIRCGQDLLTAKALGARAGMIGRAFIYGLGAYGEDGVRRVLEILYDELDKTMAFCGHTNINYINQNILAQSTF
ncbi:alpha-hydroxy acid oxidase [Cysteiniphilum sp. JM-1]|uniref:alpha-hydroxy acid oxidase n=1 Tax=Cysteiniphilum sp. JM-1 TaxID=2610891 RepID=UPI0012460409|nr:alpha-hydroxy acid oxidase [Cysteiniphilum sp. JM-1]